MNKLSKEFYLQKDVVLVAQQLLGKVLVTNFNGKLTSGIICETEAYNGVIDKASHAYNGRRTNRTETMFNEGGITYIYLCYGIHHLFNVVTNTIDCPHAVLIRGIQPLDGVNEILKRKKISSLYKKIGLGPGNVSSCLGLLTKHNKTDLLGDEIWIEDRGLKLITKKIIVGPRIGVNYAGEDAKLQYRFQYHFDIK